MIRLTTGQLVKAVGNPQFNLPSPFFRLLEDRNLSIRTRMTIGLIWKQMQAALDEYEKARLELAQRYGEKNAESDQYEILDEHKEEHAKEWDEIISAELEFTGERLSVNDLEPRRPIGADDGGRDLSLSAGEMLALEWLFKEFQDKAAEKPAGKKSDRGIDDPARNLKGMRQRPRRKH